MIPIVLHIFGLASNSVSIAKELGGGDISEGEKLTLLIINLSRYTQIYLNGRGIQAVLVTGFPAPAVPITPVPPLPVPAPPRLRQGRCPEGGPPPSQLLITSHPPGGASGLCADPPRPARPGPALPQVPPPPTSCRG